MVYNGVLPFFKSVLLVIVLVVCFIYVDMLVLGLSAYLSDEVFPLLVFVLYVFGIVLVLLWPLATLPLLLLLLLLILLLDEYTIFPLLPTYELNTLVLILLFIVLILLFKVFALELFVFLTESLVYLTVSGATDGVNLTVPKLAVVLSDPACSAIILLYILFVFYWIIF